MAGRQQPLLRALCTLLTCLLLGASSAPSGSARTLASVEIVAQAEQSTEDDGEHALVAAPMLSAGAQRPATWTVSLATPRRLATPTRGAHAPIYYLHCALLI